MSELLEASVVKTVAYALSERVIEVEIVHDRKAHGEHFFRLEQMPDIRAGIASAHRAAALRIDGQLVRLILLVLDVDYAAPCEQVPVTPVARRHDAVKEINAARHLSMMFDGVPTPMR